MREQLLGYLLGALEPAEHASIEARLSEDSQLRRELEIVRATLRPLDDADCEADELVPPPGLAARTYQFVRSHTTWCSLGQAVGTNSGWRTPDYLIAAGIFIAASMLVFPAINNSRAGARLTACQNKLRLLGSAIAQYGQIFGYQPPVPASGPFAAAGVYAPELRQAGLIESPSQIICPDSELADVELSGIPALRELETADEATLRGLHRMMGGSYGYHPGHIENGRYFPTKCGARDCFAIMADAVDDSGGDHSLNHGRRGQNVLCQSGRVFFIVTPRLENGDHIYINDMGVKGAGHGAYDSSICNSSVPPIVTPVTFGK